MEHRDAQGQSVFISRALRRLSQLDSVGFGAYWAESARQIPDKGDLSSYWIGISSARDFLGIALSYTSIRDPVLRLCHRLIACSIAGRSQAPKKVFEVIRFGEEAWGDDIWRPGLTVIVRDLPVIDMAELGAATGTPEAAEDAPIVDEGAPAIPAPVQAPQPPPPVAGPARTMA
ncbi:hypothetical protein Tco_1102271 [Tanacetum coccineum]